MCAASTTAKIAEAGSRKERHSSSVEIIAPPIPPSPSPPPTQQIPPPLPPLIMAPRSLQPATATSSSGLLATTSTLSLEDDGDNPVLKGLGNRRVLEKILARLPFEDVVNCCRVRSDWKEAGSKQKKNWALFKILIQLSSTTVTVLPENVEEVSTKLVIKLGEGREGPDMPITFYSAITMDRLLEKLNLVKSERMKLAIWIVLNFKHRPNTLVKLELFNSLKSLFNLVRPHVTRLVIDGSSRLKAPEPPVVVRRGPRLSEDDDDDDDVEPIHYLLLDSPRLRHLYFRHPKKQIVTIPPSPFLNTVKVLRFSPNFSLTPPPVAGEPPASSDVTNVTAAQKPPSPSASSSFLLSVLEACSNVDAIFNFPLDAFHFLRSGDRFDVHALAKVKCLGYQLRLDTLNEKSNELTNLSLVAEQKLCLESLTVRWSEKNTFVLVSHWKNCYENFSTILSSSRLTLQRLEICNASFVPHVNFPVLPSLTTLKIQGPGIDGVKVFCHFSLGQDQLQEGQRRDADSDDGFELVKKFPNLCRLEITNLTGDLSHLDGLLPPTIFVPKVGMEGGGVSKQFEMNKVRHLTLRDRSGEGIPNVGPDIMQRLTVYFPHVQTLDVGQDWNWLEGLLPAVWTFWPHLCELTTEILATDSRQRTKCLDEVITGIPEEKCRELRKSRKRMDIDIDIYRSLPAISNMKYLKRWSILCADQFAGRKKSVPPMLTHVSTFYGFQLVPDLVVNLRVSTDRV